MSSLTELVDKMRFFTEMPLVNKKNILLCFQQNKNSRPTKFCTILQEKFKQLDNFYKLAKNLMDSISKFVSENRSDENVIILSQAQHEFDAYSRIIDDSIIMISTKLSEIEIPPLYPK